MRQVSWKWFFSWEGRVQRLQYFLAGTALVAAKYAIDWSVAVRFGETWRIWNYFLPLREVSLFGLGGRQPELYGILWAIAIPFFWVGIALTLRRLHDAGKSAGWIFLFFIPLANLVLFLWLTLTPSAPAEIVKDIATDDPRRKSSTRRAALGIVLAVALGLALVTLSARVLMGYAWGLFLGVPFLTGFVSSWFLNAETPRTRFETISVSILTTLLIGLTLIGLKYEGLFCLLMALPLALPFSIAGGLIASYILRSRNRTSTPPTFAAWLAILPLMMFAEHAAKLEPPVVSVTTSVTIDAPVSGVWKNVVAFAPLTPPEEWLFHAGIAYPTSARIVGSGPGAVRYCRFSTGDFVEPITVWDQDRLLAFEVATQPQVMRELSPWKITPPHIERNYMRSRRGQFRLVALSDRRTLLEGTTWYQNYFWPQVYWRAWSDGIIRRIHLRVLQHVKQQAEAR
jgi:uncharacterized membrane protein YhaH (DUF805 family)